MFLRYFSFKKLPFTSSASRNVYYFRMSRLLLWKAPHLSIRKKSNSGRNDSGRIVDRSKTSLLTRVKNIQINYSFRFLKPSFVSHFQFLPFKNKTVSLIHFSDGALTYYLTTERHKLFSLIYLTKRRRLKFFFKDIVFNILLKIKNLTLVSLIEIIPGRGAQYCRSSGTLAKVLKFDLKNYSTLIKLPSGYTKSFSCYSFAALGRVGFKQNRNFLNSKAGYWRKFGSKSIVRGVAKNPVDHPHGGRTKSIRYPRTSWGKTTKFK